VIQEFLFDRVAVEPRDGAQPAGDRGPSAAAGFQVAGKALDVGAAGTEQPQVVLLAPAGVLAQVQLIGVAGQAAVPGQVSGEGQPLGVSEYRRSRDQRGGGGRGGHRVPPGFGLRPRGRASQGPSKRREPHGKTAPTSTPRHDPRSGRQYSTTDPDMCSLSPNIYCSRARRICFLANANHPVMRPTPQAAQSGRTKTISNIRLSQHQPHMITRLEPGTRQNGRIPPPAYQDQWHCARSGPRITPRSRPWIQDLKA